MIESRPIDHIAVAVNSIESSAPLYELLSGGRCSPVETLPAQGVRVAFVGGIELIEPLTPDSSVARFIERSGEGLHHVAYVVDDVAAELERLSAEGLELIDSEPRDGAGGHRVAFLHPRSTGRVLIELVEHAPPINPRPG